MMCRRILVVDDEPQATSALKRLLERKEYTVLELNDSVKALETAKEFRPHVIILDYLMPRAHGGDVAWQIASDPGLSQTRVVICSGVDPSEIKFRLPPTRIPIVEKPVDEDELLSLLRERE